MQTLKLRYKTSDDNIKVILDYMRQYSSVLHYVYNRNKEGKSQKEIKELVKTLNNIEMLDSWFIQCSFFDIPKDEKVIFKCMKVGYLTHTHKASIETIERETGLKFNFI